MDESFALRIENRVRVAIMDLIEPTIRRSTEVSEALNKLTYQSEVMAGKITDIELIQSKAISKLSILDDHSRKFVELVSNQNLFESRTYKDKQELQTQIYKAAEVMNSIKEEVVVMEHQRLDMKGEIANNSYSLLNAKMDLEEKVAAFKDEYRDKLTDIEERVMRAEVESLELLKKLRKVDQEAGKATSLATVNCRSIEDLKESIKDLENQLIKNKTEATNNFELARMSGIKLQAELTRLEKGLGGIKKIFSQFEEKIAKSQLKATQPLYKIFTDVTVLKTLAAYDLERLIKDPDYELDAKALANNIKENAENIMKLETPRPPSVSSVKSKKKKRVRLNSKGDSKGGKHRTHKNSIEGDLGERVNRPSRRKKSLAMDKLIPKPNEVVEISSTNPVISINNYKKENQFYSSSSDSESEFFIPEQIDYMPMINKAKEEVQIELKNEIHSKVQNLSENTQSQIKGLKAALKTASTELSKDVSLFKDLTNRKFSENAQKIHDIDLVVQQVTFECNSQLNNRKRENNDFHFELKTLNEKLEAYNKQYFALVDSIESLSKKISIMIEYSAVANALQIQDEVDRESISLMGYREAKPTKGQHKLARPVISMEKQCFSCTNQSSIVLNAFKIACLAYTPSQVTFQNEKYSRRELLELQSTILSSLIPISLSPFSPVSDKRKRAASTTMKYWRPVSVPSPNASPQIDFYDAELPKILRKTTNL